MKKTLLITAAFIIFTIAISITSCEKSDITNPTIADKLTGNFVVTEQARTVAGSQRYLPVDTVFHSKITRLDDSTISFIDTILSRRRVYAGFSFNRTIKPTTRELWAVGYNQGSYSLNNDTLTISYAFGVDTYTAYIVKQKWVRE